MLQIYNIFGELIVADEADSVKDLLLKYKHGVSFVGANLQKRDLSEIEIDYMDLYNADFSESFINCSVFKYIDFGDAVFAGSVIQNTTFINCKFSVNKFHYAKLYNVKFIDCDISFCRSQEGRFKEVSFINSNISLSDFDSCYIQESKFEHLDVANVKLNHCIITDTVLSTVSLSTVNVDNSILVKVVNTSNSYNNLRVVNCSIKGCDIDGLQEGAINIVGKYVIASYFGNKLAITYGEDFNHIVIKQFNRWIVDYRHIQMSNDINDNEMTEILNIIDTIASYRNISIERIRYEAIVRNSYTPLSEEYINKEYEDTSCSDENIEDNDINI